MADVDDDGFDEAFKGFGDDTTPPATPPVVDPATPPAPPATPPPAAAEPPKADPAAPEAPKPPEEPKNDEPATPPAETPPVPGEQKKPPEDPKPPETPEAPTAPEVPQPLTKSDVESVVSNLLQTERASGQKLETAAKEVLEAYYPDGLSNVLVDEKSGRELRTPADVVEASGNTMDTDQAAQWLLNEQFKLDQRVSQIKDQAKTIAETTMNFKRDATTALQKYAPLFEWQPNLQEKVYKKLMEQVKVDKDKNVVLSAPDVLGHYDFYLEPYRLAFEFSQKQPGTAPTTPPPGTPPEPPKPGPEDRMDEGGDGGQSPVDDPNDFAQQVTKELARDI